jgi:hypothetical protein
LTLFYKFLGFVSYSCSYWLPAESCHWKFDDTAKILPPRENSDAFLSVSTSEILSMTTRYLQKYKGLKF